MSNVRVTLLADLLEEARNHTLHIAAGVPESHRLKQVQAGKATPLWLVGHLANTLNTLVLVYTLEESSALSREQSKLFAPDFVGGKTPTSNAEEYPDWEEVIDLYKSVFELTLPGIRKMNDDALAASLPGKLPDALREYFSSIGTTLSIMVHHDGYHRGQIGMLAKLD